MMINTMYVSHKLFWNIVIDVFWLWKPIVGKINLFMKEVFVTLTHKQKSGKALRVQKVSDLYWM